ncbi:hypothetical protein CC78DRAFT_224277 [Lojkania enalia]|uniref:RTA1 domain protein n=1 Tax=Lojkania enalia TaxID=147567 RepID=A0A9P4KDW9_9PLEO|nr:hypothetical protein CC78DRAFT_224277 [Didymosphaeria enalia]
MATPTTIYSRPATTTPTPTCTTAVPGHHGYVPPDACNANWAYSPSFAAAIAFSILFGILTLSQIALAITYRKVFCWVMIMGCSWELVSFITRALGSMNQQSQPLAFASSLLFLLAPLWINAYVYMTAGRLIWTFHPERTVMRIKAINMGKYFVWLDILSFIVQGIGGTMLNPGASASTMETGKNIYMTGVGIQELFIILFTGLIVRFQMEVSRLEKAQGLKQAETWRRLAYALYAVLLLITTRIIFRLVEFSAGIETSNPLPYHEVYPLVLDAFPMLMAALILTVIHPGLVLKGPDSEFPPRKQRKAEKKAKKAEKKALKMHKRRERNGWSHDAYLPVQMSNEQPITSNVEMGVIPKN